MVSNPVLLHIYLAYQEKNSISFTIVVGFEYLKDQKHSIVRLWKLTTLLPWILQKLICITWHIFFNINIYIIYIFKVLKRNLKPKQFTKHLLE